MLAAGDAHQPYPIAQVVLQGPCDAAAQIGPSGLAGSAAGSGAHQGLTGHLDQILPLHQREEAPGGGGSQGISERQVLQHQGIAGTQGRTDERLGLLLAARGGKRGSHLGTAENPTPTGRPQRRGMRWVCPGPEAPPSRHHLQQDLQPRKSFETDQRFNYDIVWTSRDQGTEEPANISVSTIKERQTVK